MIFNRVIPYFGKSASEFENTGAAIIKVNRATDNIEATLSIPIGTLLPETIDSFSLIENGLYWPIQTVTVVNGYVYRKKKNLSFLNAIGVDLDYYKIERYKDQLPSEIFDMACEILKKSTLCVLSLPSIFISTGRGVQLIWLIEPEANTDFSRNICERITEKIISILSELNTDPQCKDIGHLFRFPGSLHEKTGNSVQYYLIDDLALSVHEMAQIFKVDRNGLTNYKSMPYENRRSSSTSSNSITKSFRGRSYAKTREYEYDDLLKIVRYRSLKKGEGRYPILLLVARIVCFDKNALEKLSTINQLFKDQYSAKALDAILARVTEGVKNNTFIKMPFMIKVHEIGQDAVVYSINSTKLEALRVSQEEMEMLKLNYFIAGPYKFRRKLAIYQLNLEKVKQKNRMEFGDLKQQVIYNSHLEDMEELIDIFDVPYVQRNRSIFYSKILNGFRPLSLRCVERLFETAIKRKKNNLALLNNFKKYYTTKRSYWNSKFINKNMCHESSEAQEQ